MGFIDFSEEFKNGNMVDSLADNSFSVIKDPNGTYFLGFPYNKHFSSVSELLDFFKANGQSIDNSSIFRLNNLDEYGLVVLQTNGEGIKSSDVHYLYSIPSYAGGGE